MNDVKRVLTELAAETLIEKIKAEPERQSLKRALKREVRAPKVRKRAASLHEKTKPMWEA